MMRFLANIDRLNDLTAWHINQADRGFTRIENDCQLWLIGRRCTWSASRLRNSKIYYEKAKYRRDSNIAKTSSCYKCVHPPIVSNQDLEKDLESLVDLT